MLQTLIPVRHAPSAEELRAHLTSLIEAACLLRSAYPPSTRDEARIFLIESAIDETREKLFGVQVTEADHDMRIYLAEQQEAHVFA